MGKAIYHNYELDYLGHSIIVTDDHGIIVKTVLPFKKFRGKTIEWLDNFLKNRENYHGLKDLGKTTDEVLKVRGENV